ncbi:uncharacterized protein LOC125371189 [Ricinus communis]|uniref:uncharacterized protein LOC125371189 n=1 Tax=Ricinus communis TaxID=3988 RepID=UPI00201AFF23|nr:uncharacterized protein LOC125371189 [Ricinus communis]
MLSERPSGSLPSTTESNPREHCKAITLCSGKNLTSSSPLADKDNTIVQVEPAKEGPDLEMVENERKKEEQQRQGSMHHIPARLRQDMVDMQYNFVVIDMEGDSTVPLILGRPFLATSRDVIDVSDGKLKLRVNDETITFDLATSMRQSLDYDNTSGVRKVKTSFEDPPVLELKELPSHLVYAFLDEEKRLPSNHSGTDLTPEEQAMLLEVLRKYKKAFAFNIADIPGINPSFYSHKISLGDSHVTSKTTQSEHERSGKERQWQLSELDEWRQQAYENSSTYKARTKKWHDQRIREPKEFQVGDRVLLYNSRLRLLPGSCCTRWSGPFRIGQVFPYGVVELHHPEKGNFKVNGHRLKRYHCNSLDSEQRVDWLCMHRRVWGQGDSSRQKASPGKTPFHHGFYGHHGRITVSLMSTGQSQDRVEG